MNTDDRDIVCQQDYTPLSNAELVEAIERYAAIMHTAPLIDFDLERITGPARALLARAEAAEAEAARLRNERDVQQSRIKTLLNRNSAQAARMRTAAARVAELEAQLAAQQWRPVTNEWPPQEESTPVRMRNGVIRWGYRHGDRWHLTGGQYSRESVTHAYALPPAPAAAEATE